ncbi:MAG: RNA methyltransferase [Paludibacteraceae bacterium]|nr:RNA methyltransferase [Paludibacteraceae bacterium]
MLSKVRIKYFNSLKNKKFRDADEVFVAEGDKLVTDLIPHFTPKFIVGTRPWIDLHRHILDDLPCEIIDATDDEMGRITMLNTPSAVYGVFGRECVDTASDVGDELVLALDTVQDPGNLGTIIRTADWFGVRKIICSHGTADVYNPKVVQSTMGAIARVRIHYCDLRETLSQYNRDGWALYGTFLDGKDIYGEKLCKERSVIVMGNEGKGISDEISALVSKRILIPSYPVGTPTSESLNVSIATGIILSEFRRR